MTVWYFMLKKRLLRHVSFILLLCLIPACAFAMKLSSNDDAGIVSIALAAENENDPVAKNAILDLTDDESVVSFILCGDPSEAENLVAQGKCDGAWVLKDDLSGKIENIVKGKSEQLATVITGKNQVFLDLAKEKLFASLYHPMALCAFRAHSSENLDSYVPTEEELEYYFNLAKFDGSIVDFAILESDGDTALMTNEDTTDYLTIPVRGMILILLSMCGVAAHMFYLEDEKNGVFSRIPENKRVFLAIASDLAALSLGGLSAFLALILSEDNVSPFRTALILTVYVVVCAPFSALVGKTARTTSVLGGAAAAIAITSVIVCPVFINIESLGFVRFLFPSFYALKAFYNNAYLLYALLFGAVCFLLCTALEKLHRKRA